WVLVGQPPLLLPVSVARLTPEGAELVERAAGFFPLDGFDEGIVSAEHVVAAQRRWLVQDLMRGEDVGVGGSHEAMLALSHDSRAVDLTSPRRRRRAARRSPTGRRGPGWTPGPHGRAARPRPDRAPPRAPTPRAGGHGGRWLPPDPKR